MIRAMTIVLDHAGCHASDADSRTPRSDTPRSATLPNPCNPSGELCMRLSRHLAPGLDQRERGAPAGGFSKLVLGVLTEPAQLLPRSRNDGNRGSRPTLNCRGSHR